MWHRNQDLTPWASGRLGRALRAVAQPGQTFATLPLRARATSVPLSREQKQRAFEKAIPARTRVHVQAYDSTTHVYKPGDRVQTPNGPGTVKKVLRTRVQVDYDKVVQRGNQRIIQEPVSKKDLRPL